MIILMRWLIFKNINQHIKIVIKIQNFSVKQQWKIQATMIFKKEIIFNN